MNEKINPRIAFVASLTIVVLFLNSCNIVGIESEPVTVQIEPTVKSPETAQPTPTQAIEEVVTPTAISVDSTATPVLVEEEPTPEPTSIATAEPPVQIDYSNTETGISFRYPSGWTMEEEANAFVFRNGSTSLRIAYRSEGEQVDLWTATGLPAGDLVVLDGVTPFHGQSLTKNGLVYEDRLKMVFYGGPPVSNIEAEAMAFNIALSDQESDYLTLNIPGDILAEADAILASFAVDSTLTNSSGELLTYTNPECGFSLQYPPSWSVTDVNDEASAAPSSRSVWLTQGTVTLVIGYRQTGEAPPSVGTSVPAGDLETRGSIQLLGRDVPRQVLVFEGKDKAVFYGQPGVFINAGGLEFAPRLDDFAQIDYGAIELSQDVQDEADLILSSLEIFDQEG